MRVPTLLLAISLLTVVGARGDVRVGPESVRVHSVGQPLSEILTQLSKVASFELKYEGPAPSVRVYATIEGRSISETVSRLLEGTGVTWAARFDATGASIELLVVGGPIQASPATPSRPGHPSVRPAVEPPPEPIEEDEPPITEPEPEAPPEPPEPAPSSPTFPGSPSGGAWSGGFGSSLPRYESPLGTGGGFAQPNMPTPQPLQLPRGASTP